ncbi:aldo/keto reductase [Mucilaginibacter calamicampi]|uniref:Aldo/keto reductase n=1 Tax=Mucilaginibacter calamicampi TaxID=1302352 RepID=A0ABW2YZ84_9SPHI
MRKVELAKDIYSSILGFGCAPIMGSVDASTGKRALYCALDAGVNHLDLARSYGYGEAEKFAGKLIKGMRHDLVLASKFGIVANWKANLIAPVKPLVRYALGKVKKSNPVPSKPTGQETGVTIANRFLERVPITADEMRKSLDKTLKALGTDYLDCLFIHEPLEILLNVNELIAEADLLKQQGKIRALGLACMRTQMPLHTGYLNKFDLLQFDNSPGAPGYGKAAAERGSSSNVIFSPMRGGSEQITPADKLKQLYTDFSNSVVVCSMFNTDHIAANAAVAELS